MNQTTIPWCDYTLNPGVYGCSPCSDGCTHCYAARMARRLVAMGRYPAEVVDEDGWTGKVVTEGDWSKVDRRILGAPTHRGRRRRVFVTSMGDLLHEDLAVLRVESFIARMKVRADIDWLILTKRGYRWPEVSEACGGLPANIWPGVSVCNQADADQQIPGLLRADAWGPRWVSCEPLLGPVDLTRIGDGGELGVTYNALQGGLTCSTDLGGPRLSWVIVGGESGPGARPMDPASARSLRDQTWTAGVPFFFKSWGRWGCSPIFPGAPRNDGHLLDGREWREVPLCSATDEGLLRCLDCGCIYVEDEDHHCDRAPDAGGEVPS